MTAIQRFNPHGTFKSGKFVVLMKAADDGEYVHMPNDGRPFTTDEYVARLMKSPISHQELPTAMQAWVDKDWTEAVAILENYEAIHA